MRDLPSKPLPGQFKVWRRRKAAIEKALKGPPAPNPGWFKPGYDPRREGNGRKEGRTIGDALRAKLKEPVNGISGQTWAELVADVLLIEGTTRRRSDAWRVMADMTEPKRVAISLNMVQTLKQRADEYGIDIRSDPVLSELFTAAGVDVTGSEEAGLFGEDAAGEAGRETS